MEAWFGKAREKNPEDTIDLRIPKAGAIGEVQVASRMR